MIEAIKQFMEGVGQTTSKYNANQMGLYIGLILEEVGELVTELGNKDYARDINQLADLYKSGEFVLRLENLAQHDKLHLMLDHCLDIAWVAQCLGFSMGSDVPGAVS